MCRFKIKTILISNLIVFFLFVFNDSAFGMELKISPFALYEQGKDDISIDGIRTKYGLGVVGATVQANLENGLKIYSRLGYGYHPNARVSITVEEKTASMKGPTSGRYTETGIKIPLWNKSKFAVVTEIKSTWRNVVADDLAGFAGLSNWLVTGEAINDLDTLDFLLRFNFPVGEFAFVTLTGGRSKWHLRSESKVYFIDHPVYTSGSRPPIDTKSSDPFFGISITSNNPMHNFSLELYNRSLNSKAGTSIIGLEAGYVYQF
jgi:hypothetical protein